MRHRSPRNSGYSPLSFHFAFSLCLGDSPIKTELLSERAVKPKTTNQPLEAILMRTHKIPVSENQKITPIMPSDLEL